ncbi:MAG: glycosyltransferase family 4 protein [Cyanobacteria bacterium]|nr:glycosyltransferase family 4 protein [Cyanobacteria bacterium CG_2015-16_32_12]NCO77641.1 glycosyltransferase family 4 protein [Cyanobacteria bacterium CG_2015-22_32_23]NCQ04303.1 glycosyltransferase family 4 protein [Cyanobacteria bacterium CG_2015-09_32_10]NCQ42948.1 glycosyltransferase family 4 protein [Cyanobacteria bacterium CG_2015-04_32_10]NCS84536.1 glycosyltransferase family 4 protein [Cyanobacteria bacterium CG_2015-02_32_10]
MLLSSTENQQQQLRKQLKLAIEDLKIIHSSSEYDFIISHSEVNDRHGVGVLLKRLFNDDQQIVSIRSHNLYDGKDDFGNFNFLIHHENHDIASVYSHIQSVLEDLKPRRILSIPYFIDDFLSTIAIKNLFDVPLCTYLMDDQNIYIDEIPDRFMAELIEKSDLCFGISRNLCEAYQKKYHKKFWFVPPVAPEKFIPSNTVIFPSQLQEQHGVLIGNIWSQKWLDRLRETIRGSGVKIDWYGNPHREWLKFDETELAEDGIIFKGYLESESELVNKLRQSSFAIIPTAQEISNSERMEIAKLSLPSRIPFLVATAHTPLLVIGNNETAAANFVTDFQLGAVCGYDTINFRETIAWITDAENQDGIRHQASNLAKFLSSKGIADWIWDSLAQKYPLDLRFEKLGQYLPEATIIITANEVNNRHGTGFLVRRVVGDTPNILSIRSRNDYGGLHNFGDATFCLPHTDISRIDAFLSMAKLLEGVKIKEIFCIPYYPDDLLLSIAIKELFNVPLGVYIMDDQNVVVNKIPDEIMREFLTKCSFRLATHPELRDAYEEKYNLKFWLLPAVVPNSIITTTVTYPQQNLLKNQTGALIGSIWSKKWFEMLTDTITNAGIKLDWYGNAKYQWLTDSWEDISKKTGITPYGIVAEPELGQKLQQYPYIVVPTGTVDERDDHPELSRLSLPGRIIFALASSHTPIILLGSEKTSAARFVKTFGIGIICDYNPESFKKAVDYVTQPEIQKEMRHHALSVAEKFSDKHINHWIWESLHQGKPSDLKFEHLFA